MQNNLDKKILCGSKFKNILDAGVKNKICTVISFVNPFSYMEVIKDKELVNDIEYYFSDGALLCKMHSLFYSKITRASFDFSSIADYFLQYSADNYLSIAIVGALQSEVELAVINLKELYPQLNIVYFRDGYIRDVTQLINDLNKSMPKIVLLGMGSPHQERMAISLKYKLKNTSLIITCGGFLTQTSIKADYYHPLIKKLGLRWLQRVILHKHVRDRVLKDYPKFVYYYLSSKMKNNAR
jgi:N-acetylglucosaminyldiphosphoundecaprenol N-acetyl-beta-D-mannosaminyltransferase